MAEMLVATRGSELDHSTVGVACQRGFHQILELVARSQREVAGGRRAESAVRTV